MSGCCCCHAEARRAGAEGRHNRSADLCRAVVVVDLIDGWFNIFLQMLYNILLQAVVARPPLLGTGGGGLGGGG